MHEKPMVNRSREIVWGHEVGIALGNHSTYPETGPLPDPPALGAFARVEEADLLGVPICHLPRPVRRMRGRLHPRRRFCAWARDRYGNEGPATAPPVHFESIHRHTMVSFRWYDTEVGLTNQWYATHRGYLAHLNLSSNPHWVQRSEYLFFVTGRYRVYPGSVLNLDQLHPRVGTNVINFYAFNPPAWASGMPVWDNTTNFAIPCLADFTEANPAYSKRDLIDAINNRNMAPLTMHGMGFVISDGRYRLDSGGNPVSSDCWYARFKPVRINPFGLTITRFQGTPHEITVPRAFNCIGTRFNDDGTLNPNAFAHAGMNAGFSNAEHTDTVMRPDLCMIYQPTQLDPLTTANYNALKPQWMAGLFELDYDPIADYLGEGYARKLITQMFNLFLPGESASMTHRFADFSKHPRDLVPYRKDDNTWETREWFETSWSSSYPYIWNSSSFGRGSGLFHDRDERRFFSIDLTPFLAHQPTRWADREGVLVIRNDKKAAFRHLWNRRFSHAMGDNEQESAIGSAGYGTCPIEINTLYQIVDVTDLAQGGNPTTNRSRSDEFLRFFNTGLYLLGITRVRRAVRRWIRKLIVDQDGQPVLEEEDIRFGSNVYTCDMFLRLAFRDGMSGRSWNPSQDLYLWSPGNFSTNALALDLPPLTPAANTPEARVNLRDRWRNWVTNYRNWCTHQFLMSADEITAEDHLFNYDGESSSETLAQPQTRELNILLKHLNAQNRRSIAFWNDVVALLRENASWVPIEIILRYGRRVTVRSGFMSNRFTSNNHDISWFIESQRRQAHYRERFFSLIAQMPDTIVLPRLTQNAWGQPLGGPVNTARPAGGVTIDGVYYPPIRQLIRGGATPGGVLIHYENNEAQVHRRMGLATGLWFFKHKAFFESENANGRPFAFDHPLFSFPNPTIDQRRVRLAHFPLS